MRKIISLVMLLLPCTVFAATDCRVVEYPDHSEAICDGDAAQTTASSRKTAQEQIPGQEQTIASPHTTESEQADVLPEKIEMNALARSHASSWLKTRPGQ